MNGQEHYVEAERLIQRARGSFGDHYLHNTAVDYLLAEAQVHATLAMAATLKAVYIRVDQDAS